MSVGQHDDNSLAAALVEPAAARARRWAIDLALPLWSQAGFDCRHGRFEEQLTLQGQPVAGAPQRLIVQARQIYSYSLAARRGWHVGAAALSEKAYRSMLRDFRDRDGRDGWVFSIHRDGAVADGRRDLYAHAFVLLGVASYVAASGERKELSVADDVLDFIDRDMRAPDAGGYVESLPAQEEFRRQNPHMHLFEGLLSLWSSSGDEKYLDRARRIFDLFAERFFRPQNGVLLEYFDRSLRPALGIQGRIVEPGHHYEWIWLLRWFERATGHSVQTYVDELYRHADAYGYDDDGLIVDELLDDGTQRLRSRRTWPVTEAIKANLVEASCGRPDAAAKVVALVDRLHEKFLTNDPPGGWIDRLDAQGHPAVDFMPASTLYHAICAVDELDGLASGRSR